MADDSVTPETPRLLAGTRFGPYEVRGLLGRGGMGEVYRAHDARLARDVALKVLPRRWATDPGRRARFEREARLLASLRHTSIAAIYHLEEQDGTLALVLEMVEGPTLGERLDAGPLDWRTALSLSRHLVDALDAAHRRGIMHRDLKPANVKVQPDGSVKVLDFGLARAFAAEDGSDVGSDVGGALTTLDGQFGRGPGTVGYMSPEQTLGQRVDARTDVWAFGCVLYEMLTGRPAFAGSGVTDVRQAVLTREPDLSRLPDGTPEPLRRLLSRCLRKDPRKRLGYIGDVHLELDEALAAGPDALPRAQGSPRATRIVRPMDALALGVLLALGGSGTWWVSRPGVPPSRSLRLALPLMEGERYVWSDVSTIALSADGSLAAYGARRGEVPQLFVRSLDGMTSMAIPGSENATAPFFSPDKGWVAFERDGELMKVSLAGSPAIRICSAPGGASGVWAENDTIYFSAGANRVIQRVSAAGGAPEALTSVRIREGEVSHATPALLPGGRTLLFTIFRTDGARIAALDLTTRAITALVEGKQPSYLAPGPHGAGHLVFARQGALWVAPFDARAGRMTGEPVPAVTAVLDAGGFNGGAQFALAPAGALLYAPAQPVVPERALLWYDRDGTEIALPLEPRAISHLSLAPDGGRVALSVVTGPNHDIWIHDLDRAAMTRVTTHPEMDAVPIWSPDGRSLAYRSHRDGGGLFLQQVDPPGEARRLTSPNGPEHSPSDFTQDGQAILFTEVRSYHQQDIGMVDIDSGEVTWLLTGAAAEMRPRLSPDGRWLAYSSNASGRFEVYVRPFPEVHARRWQISSHGGMSPQWSADGRELWFDDGRALHVVDVSVARGTFEASRPRALMSAANMYRDRLGASYELAPDGRRVLTASMDLRPPALPSPLMILEGWLPPRVRARGH
jgi:eukaryotic-like serine/threonine-protein kinase